MLRALLHKWRALCPIGACSLLKARRMHNIDDLHRLAKQRLPRGLYAMLERGAEDEVTMERNRSELEKLTLKPRTLVDVSRRSQAVTLFGKVSRSPVMIGPTGFAGLAAFEGELKLARAAAAAGVPYVLGSVSMTSMERVMQHGGGRLWFQLFPWADLAMNDEVIERALAAGYEALVITTDTPVIGNLEHILNSGFKLPFRYGFRNVLDVLACRASRTTRRRFATPSRRHRGPASCPSCPTPLLGKACVRCGASGRGH